MKRILVIGSPGSGKTTFSLRLSQKLGIECIHLDRLFWKDGWTESTKEEFDFKLLKELEKDEWIIDGNYGRTLDMRLPHADRVIFFDYPCVVCAWRVVKRVLANYGKSRPDIGENCPERFNAEFMKYIINFKKKQGVKILKKLSAYPDLKVSHIQNKKDMARLEKEFFGS